VRHYQLAAARRASACLLALGLSGCAMSYSARSLGVPVTMAGAVGEPVAGDTFTVTTRGMHLFWGAVTARQPSLQNVLAGQLGTGGGVRNLTIRSRKRWSDLLVTALTVGVLSPTSVTFEGVVTRSAP
jgi:LytS/YehU family sensor histidine kinase